MRLKEIAVACLMVSAAALCAGKDQAEHLKFTTGPEWKLVNSREAHHSVIMEFVRAGDELNNWKELVTIQNFSRSGIMHSAEESFSDLQAKREKECPGTTEWSVIDKSDGSILYEWHAKTCLNQPDQSEIARIIFGKHNVFWLHYAAKGLVFPPDARAEWVKRLTAAGIAPAP